MLMVTKNAKRHLKRLLMTHAGSHNLGIRLRIGTGLQMGVVLDRKADDDYIVEYEGEEVLMVSPELLPLVDGATLDTDGSGASLFITKGSKQPGIKKGGRRPSKKARGNPCLEWFAHNAHGQCCS